MRIFRLGDERHPIWDGSGAALIGGRWNSPGKPVIYGSLSYACAMLEILAHANIGRIPSTQRFIIAEVPDGVSIEKHDVTELPLGWDTDHAACSRAFGDQWLVENRSAILLVPSVVARLDWNAVVNPNHPDAQQLILTTPEPVIWDQRLFEHFSGNRISS
jgi:RES domain-containing protein